MQICQQKDATIKIKVGFADRRFIEESRIKALSELPSKEELVARSWAMIAPITGLATVLNANIRDLPLCSTPCEEVTDAA